MYHFPYNDIFLVLFLLCFDEKSPLFSKHKCFFKTKKFFFTLQPSHVIAPKWMPEDGALQTAHGKRLNISATGGLLVFSSEFSLNFYISLWWIILLFTTVGHADFFAFLKTAKLTLCPCCSNNNTILIPNALVFSIFSIYTS